MHSHCTSSGVLPQFASTHVESDSTVPSGGGGATDGTSRCILITSVMLLHVDGHASVAECSQQGAFTAFLGTVS